MATIKGTNLADTLYGTSGADTISGLGGDDTIKGGGGADRIDGGSGWDMVFYSDSSVGVSVNLATGRGMGGTAEGDTFVNVEAVWGSSFNDTLTGNDLANDLYGNDGNDVLKGGGGADGLDGGNGDDILKGGGGADYLAGGAGNDTADYSQAGPVSEVYGVTVDLLHNRGFWGDAQGDTFSSIENITGSQYGDNLYGNDGANWIRGLDGIDLITGYGGNDTLDGGNGNDTLDGGTGIDTMIGGFGDDTYYVDSASDVVDDGAGQGHEWLWASTSYALSATAEIELITTIDQNSTQPINLAGNDFAQMISGNEGSNVIQGLGGSDNLSGRGGFDRLFGGEGDDLIYGGDGPDDLIGGAGADTFLYYEVKETGIAMGTWDVIHDFNRAEGDVINVGQMDSDPLMPGTQHWTFTGTATFTAPGQIGTGNDGVDTFIFFNTDSDSAPEGTIRVLGLHSVDASWFM